MKIRIFWKEEWLLTEFRDIFESFEFFILILLASWAFSALHWDVMGNFLPFRAIIAMHCVLLASGVIMFRQSGEQNNYRFREKIQLYLRKIKKLTFIALLACLGFVVFYGLLSDAQASNKYITGAGVSAFLWLTILVSQYAMNNLKNRFNYLIVSSYALVMMISIAYQNWDYLLHDFHKVFS